LSDIPSAIIIQFTVKRPQKYPSRIRSFRVAVAVSALAFPLPAAGIPRKPLPDANRAGTLITLRDAKRYGTGFYQSKSKKVITK
jgi:hypothetical protein